MSLETDVSIDQQKISDFSMDDIMVPLVFEVFLDTGKNCIDADNAPELDHGRIGLDLIFKFARVTKIFD